jgi:hypothetical protein
MNLEIKITGQNLLDWAHMEDWENGASAAPTGLILSGAGASVARESSIIKYGNYSAKVTRAGTDCYLYATISNPTDYQGRKIIFGCWVYASVASRAQISIYDGVGASTSSFHTGVAGWEWLTVTRDVDVAASDLRCRMEVITGNTNVYFDGGIACLGDIATTIITSYANLGTWKTTNRYRSQSYEVPRREGTKIPNIRIASKSLSTEGMIVGATVTAKRTSVDALMKALNSYILKPNGDVDYKNLYLYDDRYYKCFVEAADPEELASARVSKINLKFTIPEPFMYDVNKTLSKTTITGTTAFTVTNTGSAIAHPQIWIYNTTSNISSLTIENLTTGQKFNYSGSLVMGTWMLIDTETLEVENDGVSDLANANVTNEIGITLVPGANAFKVTGLAIGTAWIEWFNRYY